ncbi:MAG: ParA family protein [Ferrimicrobium sp.]
MKVLTCYSLKGGVGKTTTSVCLAHRAAEQGFRTLLFDLDTQGSATWLLRSERQEGKRVTRIAMGKPRGSDRSAGTIVGSDYENLDLVPYGVETITLEAGLASLKRPKAGVERLFGIADADYDLVVVDLPPSAGSLARAVLGGSDRVIFVMTPAMLSLHALEEAKDRIGTLSKPKTSVLFTMVEGRRRADQLAMDRTAAQGNSVLATTIPKSTLFDRMQEKRTPIALSAPNSKASQSYRSLFDEIVDLMDLAL